MNARSSEVVAQQTKIAASVLDRLVGLLGRASLPPGEALIIQQCKVVHMFFMRFAIDLLFCSAKNEVLAMQSALRPWRISKFVWGASYVVELPAETLGMLDIKIGDTLSLEEPTLDQSAGL